MYQFISLFYMYLAIIPDGTDDKISLLTPEIYYEMQEKIPPEMIEKKYDGLKDNLS